MDNKALLDAVASETRRLLAGSDGLWDKLSAQMATELAPLLADLVQQGLIQALSSKQPDHSHRTVKAVVAKLMDDWRKAQAEARQFIYPDAALMEELAVAVDELADDLPPKLAYAEAPSDSVVPLIEALCEARYAIDQARQQAPGWYELAEAVGLRITSELEVRNRA